MNIEYPVLEDIEPDYDPFWMSQVLQKDGRVIVLQRTLEKACIMLTATGCRLPLEYRPLICRLYPYTFIEQKILGIDTACPISQNKNWRGTLSDMDMHQDKADEWLFLLYSEIRDFRRSTAT